MTTRRWWERLFENPVQWRIVLVFALLLAVVWVFLLK
jgi:hypothetical protein